MRILCTLLLGAFLLWGILYAAAVLFYGVPAYHGPKSDHFDGEHFHNLGTVLSKSGQPRGLRRYLLMRLKRQFVRTEAAQEQKWPDWVEAAPGMKPPERVQGLRVTFVNHATLLVQIEGLNLLTDPQWSNRASPLSWLGPHRHRAPGLRFEDLPPIDAVLLSHNHYDHMDVPTLRRLIEYHHPQIVTPLANSHFLKSRKINATDLDWWQSTLLAGKLEVVSVPAQHFSARSVNDRNRALWGGYVIRGKCHSVYFAGDTGYAPLFREIGRRFPAISVALVPIGAYRPRWFMSPVHLSPEEAVQVQVDLGARAMVPMHYGTFKLSEEGIDEPLHDLNAELTRRGAAAPRVVVLGPGEGKDF